MELLDSQAIDIVKKAVKGDMHSFEKLLYMYQDKVFSWSMKLTGSAGDAEDLSQEVFLRAYRYISHFRGDSSFGTWLYRIALNIWLNDKRKKRVDSAYSLDDTISSEDGEVKREIADVTFEPQKVLSDSLMGEKLQKAVDSLPKDQKAAILLREVEDYTYDEIAHIMDCSVGTVKSRISRAREALKKAYNGYVEA